MVKPYTLCGNARLRGLYQAIEHIATHHIPGDVVECGSARGGSAACLGLALKHFQIRRALWLFDTFEGIPSPTAEDPDRRQAARFTGCFRGDREEVQALLARLGVESPYELVKGLFQDTVPVCSIERIAVLHLDGDWYESVKVCLEHLYNRVSPGGVIQTDDYGHWAGARKAVDEFLSPRRLSPEIRYLDYTGRQWIKTA